MPPFDTDSPFFMDQQIVYGPPQFHFIIKMDEFKAENSVIVIPWAKHCFTVETHFWGFYKHFNATEYLVFPAFYYGPLTLIH